MRATSLFSCVALFTWLGCCALAAAQSRLIGDTYTFSGTNFPGNIGATEDPVTGEVTNHGTSPVTVTIDGNAEVAGGMRVNERIVAWPGRVGGIPAVQEAGIDGETEFDLTDWENVGEVLEFSLKTVDGQWISDEILDQSFITLRGVDWTNSEPDVEPTFYGMGFYFYWTVDGQPLRDYVMTLPNRTVMVGAHPFGPTIPEVGYIVYNEGEMAEVLKPHAGGVDLTFGTTQLDEQQGSWAALASVLSLPGLAEINGKPSNAFHLGLLVTPPPSASLTGDHNGNGNLDAGDLDLQAVVMVNPPNPLPAGYDLNGDQVVDFADRKVWLHDLKKTWVGDSDLDGQFTSADFVLAFQAGKYEVVGANATWVQGDWDGDKFFTSADFVAAFADGGYEAGERPTAISAVPEPHALALLCIGVGMLLVRRSCRA